MRTLIFLFIFACSVSASAFASCVGGPDDPYPLIPCETTTETGTGTTTTTTTTTTTPTTENKGFFSGFWDTVANLTKRVLDWFGSLVNQIWWFISVWLVLTLADSAGIALVSVLAAIPVPDWIDLVSIASHFGCEMKAVMHVFALDQAFKMVPSAMFMRVILKASLGGRI